MLAEKIKSLADRPTLSWAFYDWANSAFATTVIAGFFPIFFREYWSGDVESTVTTFRLGVASSVASLVIVLLAPVLGAIADCAGVKKKLLIAFAFIGILSTLGLYLVGQGHWFAALVLFAVGSIGFSGANVFYDALLLQVAPSSDRIHAVSGLGYGLGYLGGGILFAGNVFMALHPEVFGFSNAGEAIRVSFVTVGIWWAAFTLPLILFVQEEQVSKKSGHAIRSGFRQLYDTFENIRKNRVILTFLVAYWFYIDGVDTIFRMAVDYGLSIGLRSTDLIAALLVVQFIGFPSAIVFGRLGQKIGAKTGIYIGIGVYVAVTIWAYFITSAAEFYVLAAMVGFVIGGIQALSRSLLGQLIPSDRAGEYFGFFNMVGKSAAIIGPILVGWTAVILGTRSSILSVLLLFALGAYFLYFVDVRNSQNFPETG